MKNVFLNNNIRHFLLTTIFIIFLLGLSSCSDIINSDPNINKILKDDNTPLQIIPYRITNSWVYEMRKYDSSWNIIESQISVNTVLRDTVMSGETWYTSDTAGNYWYTNKADGFHIFDLIGPDSLEDWLIIKYPGNVGDVFDFPDGYPFTIVNIDTSITVPAGTFSCYQYHRDVFADGLLLISEDKFYSPGVGHIKDDIYPNREIPWIKYYYGSIVLISYTVNSDE